MLGTDTTLSPTTKKIKKDHVLKKGEIVSDYPKGESLSLVSMQVQVANKTAINKGPIPYKTDEVTVINGPTTTGTNVGEKIGFGVAEILFAVARGQQPINIIAHSRGAVESILITHEIQAIQNMISAYSSMDEVIAELLRQQTERRKAQKPVNNTPDIIEHLKAQLKDIPQEAQASWFESLKQNIPNTSINFFGIDPVPGDCFPITWYDDRYFTMPAIAQNVQILYYENEHSSLGFTPAWVQPESPEQKFVCHTMPGHHGTGSAGNNGSQQKVVETDASVKATHVQKLLIYKLLDFLSQHGTLFNDLSQELFQRHSALGRKYAFMVKDEKQEVKAADAFAALGQVVHLKPVAEQSELELVAALVEPQEPVSPSSPKDKKIDAAKLDFPAIYRELYNKITKNKKAYEAFNTTCYTMMGVTPQRRILRKGDADKTSHTYGLLNDALPMRAGFINDEQARLIQEYFFSLFQLEHPPENLADIVNAVNSVLEQNIRPLAEHDVKEERIEDLHSSYVAVSEKRANLRDPATREVVSKTFRNVIQLVSTQYLTIDWSSVEKKVEKQQLFNAIINLIEKFKELAALEDPTAQDFVGELKSLAVSGIGETLEDQYQILSKNYTRINRSTDVGLQRFFNDLGTQFAAPNSSASINDMITEIMKSPAYLELADHPPILKISHLFEQLRINGYAELIIGIEANFKLHRSQFASAEFDSQEINIIEELAKNFVEQYTESMEAFAMLHEQMHVFMNDLSALSNLVPEKTKDFGAYVLKLRESSQALVIKAAQKFYCGHAVDELPPIAAMGSFAELAEDYAIEHYGIADRTKERQVALENANRQLHDTKEQLQREKLDVEHQLNIQTETNANVERQLQKEIKEKQDFQDALNSEEEAKCLLLISQKLRPMTEEYLQKLKNSSSNEKGSRAEKIDHLKELLQSLDNKVKEPTPSKRVGDFYNKLHTATDALNQHRDKEWIRYVKYTVIAGAILATAVFPGLLCLMVYAKYTGNSPYFWAPQGNAVVNELLKVRPSNKASPTEPEVSAEVRVPVL